MLGRKGLKGAGVSSFFLLVIFFLALFLPTESDAALDLRTVFPRYRITGLIDLTYQNYGVTTTEDGKRSESDAKTFEQRYRLGIQGYIVHPKLAVYSAAVTFRHVTIRQDDAKATSRDITYDLFLSLLQRRPYSLDLYASRQTGTVFGGGTSTDITTNNYGLTLRLSLKDIPFLKPKPAEGNGKSNGSTPSELPFVKLYYNHYDYDADSFAGPVKRDILGLDVIGRFRKINTRYTLSYEFSDFSTAQRSFNAQYFKGTTDTVLSRGKSVLSTSFQYTSADKTKYGTFTADLQLTPTDRFSHMYTYSYFHFEEDQSKSDTHFVQGTWDYRFTEKFLSHATAFYSLTRTDEEKDDAYGAAGSLHYRRPIQGLDFASTYRLSFRDSARLGQVMENSVELNLKTRKLKWGTIYASYDFIYLTTSDQGDLTEHIFRTGVRGKGPGRAYWSVEAEYENVKNTLGGISASFLGGPGEVIISGPLKSSFYSLSAEAGYPLGRRGTISLRSGYTTGTADSQDFNRYFYEARLGYSLLRNLSLIAWWREGRDRFDAEGIDRKTREYEGRLYYRLRRVFFSLEYTRWRTEESHLTTETSRLFLRLTRPI